MTFAAEEAGQILSQDARGRVLVSRERRESLLEEYDRSGMSGVEFAQYVGIKYSRLAYWLQSRRRKREREKSLMKASANTEPSKSNGAWIENLSRSTLAVRSNVMAIAPTIASPGIAPSRASRYC